MKDNYGYSLLISPFVPTNLLLKATFLLILLTSGSHCFSNSSPLVTHRTSSSLTWANFPNMVNLIMKVHACHRVSFNVLENRKGLWNDSMKTEQYKRSFVSRTKTKSGAVPRIATVIQRSARPVTYNPHIAAHPDLHCLHFLLLPKLSSFHFPLSILCKDREVKPFLGLVQTKWWRSLQRLLCLLYSVSFYIN